jgi:hypothetical protein
MARWNQRAKCSSLKKKNLGNGRRVPKKTSRCKALFFFLAIAFCLNWFLLHVVALCLFCFVI